jgi:uncharacterized membrane protein HdeD (DUF308 family)
MSTNPDFTAVPAAPHHSWGWFLLRGIVAILFGILAIFFPLGALFIFGAFFAAFALIDGIAALIIGARGMHGGRPSWGLIVSGVIGIAVGVIFLFWPILSTISYALATLALLSLWAIFTGFFELATAFRMRGRVGGEWLLGITGVLSIVLGIAIPIVTGFAPGASIVTVGWIIGIYALAAGISMTILAFRLRGKRAG